MKNKIKWYNDPQMVGSMLLFLPPVGIYGVYRSEVITLKWKKIMTITIALVVVLLVMFTYQS